MGVQFWPLWATGFGGSARTVGAGRGCGDGASAGCVIVVAAFEAPAVVTGLDDVAVVGQAVEQRGRHLGIAKHTGPLSECEIGGDDDGRAFVEAADEVEQELAAGLSEWKVAKFVKDDEVHPGQMLGDTALPSVAGLRLKPIDEVDDVVEAPAGTGPDAASGDGYGHMCLAGACSANQHDVALLGDEPAAGQVVDQRLVDRRALELEVLKVLGKRQFGDGELVLDRAGLLLVDLGVEQVADNALGFVLALDGGRHDLVEGGLHAVELEVTHEVEELSTFHQMVLLRLS